MGSMIDGFGLPQSLQWEVGVDWIRPELGYGICTVSVDMSQV